MNNNIKDKLKTDKNILDYTKDELDFAKKPIGKAHYKSRGRPKSEIKTKPNDKIKCSICGKTYTRSNSYHHKHTTYHLTHVKLNDKIRQMMFN